MDAFKKLSLELDGIKKIIYSYSHNCCAYNIIPKLEEAIKDCDKDSIVYCLDVMIEWYDNEMRERGFNQFCFKQDEHIRIYCLIKSIRNEIENCDISIYAKKETNGVDNNEPIIFLSHSSSDIKYGNALEKFITGLGVKNEQLIYTSHPLHKIPLNENIYEYLRKNINRNIFMIILWSDKYLDSPACLNEMGAAWVVQCDYTNVYVPNFPFGDPKYHQCAVDTRKMGAVLNGDENCKQSMLEFKNKIQEFFELQNDEAKSLFLLDEFIKEIKEDTHNG